MFSDFAPNVLYNGDFGTKTLEGWTAVGEENCFLDEHINDNFRFSNRPNESQTGILRSSAFKVGGENVISFRLGATKHSDLTYLSIKRVGTNDEIFRTYSNRWKESDEENTHLYYVDLSDYAGESLYIEVVDNSRGDWGLITLEQIKTYYEKLPMVYDEIAVNLLDTVVINPSFNVMRNFVNQYINQIEDETLRITLEKLFTPQ